MSHDPTLLPTLVHDARTYTRLLDALERCDTLTSAQSFEHVNGAPLAHLADAAESLAAYIAATTRTAQPARRMRASRRRERTR